ncbi:hypothetical protein [Amycolatopsis cihanbeyliensis]|uniref:Uncharacterized protein n=1 Tax=Amycolatopsis cihanbeyliensis TaxID=1128664 RepID=A0A542DHY2_AMYCI|nr:hypothetical protein [Amycolatopsis cihanbeyliensis]TQJ02692.1 hypothetical protein FB471_2430 [Amycolatopsis cihanbeyliensis]
MTTALPHNGQQPQLDDRDQRTHRHPLDAYVPDPSDKEPLCDEAEFRRELESMVADGAPRLFAVVQEYGERVDAWVVAWGMAFDDHVEVVAAEGKQWMSLRAPERALRRFKFGSHIRARLVWVGPDAATPSDDDEVA